jgi:hypothetical protein
MIRPRIHPVPSCAALAALVALAGCGGASLPRLDLPGAGASNQGTAALVENRVWLQRDPAAGPRGFVLFLSDGTLVSGPCGGPAGFAAWRWVDEAVLVWDEGEGTRRAEVGAVGPRELALILDPNGERLPRAYDAARPPAACP